MYSHYVTQFFRLIFYHYSYFAWTEFRRLWLVAGNRYLQSKGVREVGVSDDGGGLIVGGCVCVCVCVCGKGGGWGIV